MKTPKIVVVGSSNTDMVVVGSKIPAPGETVTGGRFVLAPGGKGANQAVAAARLGANVVFVAKVGDDLFGRQAVEGYQKEGIDTSRILFDPENATGVALILVDQKGENSISVASGANHALLPDEVTATLEAIGAFDILLLQLEIPMPCVERAARIAHEAGARVILDPAPAAPLNEDLVQSVDYLTPNESEAKILTGVEIVDRKTAAEAAQKLRARGAPNVIITLGAAGCLIATADGETFLPAPKIESVDSTAAGDAFNGGLAVALGKRSSPSEAARVASFVGGLACTKLGAQTSLPTQDDVRRFMEATG